MTDTIFWEIIFIMERMNMFEIENCYRIIFEAMLEASVLPCIAKGIGQYTEAGVAFVTEKGKLMACSGLWADLFPVSAEKGYLTFADYTAIYDRKEADGRYWCITPVYGDRRVIGHAALVYGKEEEKELFRELGGILAQNVKRYFGEEQKRYIYDQPLRDCMLGRMLFEEGIPEQAKEKNCPEGKYMAVLFCKEDGNAAEMSARLHNIWSRTYIYEEEDKVFVLLYQVKEKDVASIYAGIEKEKLKCCISEVFSGTCLCRGKKNILKRIAQAEGSWEGAVRREKDWFMRGMYTYTAPLFEKAGLSDYSIGQLILEDEKNHTELYHSLKTYLLCENNVTVAAKRLHIHRNTLVYRLKRIKECIDKDMNDYKVSRELLAFIMMNDIAGQRIRSGYED